jgi:hypothetical protein
MELHPVANKATWGVLGASNSPSPFPRPVPSTRTVRRRKELDALRDSHPEGASAGGYLLISRCGRSLDLGIRGVTGTRSPMTRIV